MSVPSVEAPAPSDTDKILGVLNYVMMFFAHWLGFIPAIIAVAIAYARRGDADALSATHYTFQIKTFWIGFWTGIAGAVALLFALFGGLGAAFSGAGGFDYAAVGFGGVAAIFAIIGVILLAISFFWTLIASAYGFVKQISGSPIGTP